jgi:hypothetical protein
VDLDAVADELYGLPLEDFTPTRTRRAAQAKDEGNKELAAQIKALAKPNLLAWLVNQLARQRRDLLASLLDLADQFRDATQAGDGDRVRELSRQRQQVLATLTGQAREIAAAAGRGFTADSSRGVEDTLRAAMADPDAADQVRSGRLIEPLQASGFGFGVGFTPPPARAAKGPPQPPRSAASTPRRVPRQAVEQRKAFAAADRAVAAARADATHAETALRTAHDDVANSGREEADLQRTIARLRGELDAAQKALAEAQSKKRRAGHSLEDATRKATASQRRLDNAVAARDSLAKPPT